MEKGKCRKGGSGVSMDQNNEEGTTSEMGRRVNGKDRYWKRRTEEWMAKGCSERW